MVMEKIMAVAGYINRLIKAQQIGTNNVQVQKMLYFAWGRYWAEYKEELFFDIFVAWDKGPVVTSVWNKQRPGGDGLTQYENECLEYLNDTEQNSIKKTVSEYMCYTSRELMEMTHENNGAWYRAYEISHNSVLNKDHIKKTFEMQKKVSDVFSNKQLNDALIHAMHGLSKT